jgi:hypothetical protein
MTAALSRETTAAVYHSRALEAAAQAEACVLDRVREKHEVAAARWRALAALHERGALGLIVSAPAAPRDDHDIGHREETPCTT